jgi:hypothetical protein
VVICGLPRSAGESISDEPAQHFNREAVRQHQ